MLAQVLGSDADSPSSQVLFGTAGSETGAKAGRRPAGDGDGQADLTSIPTKPVCLLTKPLMPAGDEEAD